MANLGLLGALGGLGQAMQTFGNDIVKRREAALEAAREEAKYQRTLADKRTDTQAAYAHEDKKVADMSAAATARTQAQIEGRVEEGKANRKAKVDLKLMDADQKELDRQAKIDLANLQARLKETNAKENIKLRHDLSSSDVHGVQYGQPNASGYSELLTVRTNGEVRPTGKWVLPPRKKPDDTVDPNAL